jgi:polar amino acid transport system substrate-binding protein
MWGRMISSSVGMMAVMLAGALGIVPSVRADTLDDIKAHGSMVVAIDPTFAPYEYTDNQGAIVGYDPSILEAIAKNAGVKVDYQKMAFTGIIPGLIAGSFDFSGSALNVTAERAKRIGYTIPLSKTVNAVLKRAGDERIRDSKPEALAGLKVAVKATTQPEQYMKTVSADLVAKGMKPIDILSVDTVEQTVAALVNKRVDFVVDDVSVLGNLTKQRSDQPLEIVGEIGPSQYIAWGVRKDDNKLREFLDAQIMDLKKSGKLTELQKQFLGVSFNDLPDRDFLPKE